MLPGIHVDAFLPALGALYRMRGLSERDVARALVKSRPHLERFLSEMEFATDLSVYRDLTPSQVKELAATQKSMIEECMAEMESKIHSIVDSVGSEMMERW